MIALTENLSFDPSLRLAQQPEAVRQYVQQLTATPPTDQQQEDCGADLHRPLRRVWRLASAEVVQDMEYCYPATNAACFALRAQTTTLRPLYF